LRLAAGVHLDRLDAGMSNILISRRVLHAGGTTGAAEPQHYRRSSPRDPGRRTLYGEGLLDLIRGRIWCELAGPRRGAERRSTRRSCGCLERNRSTGSSRCAISIAFDLLVGLGPNPVDLPWLPVYLVICFAFHPLYRVCRAAWRIILGFITMMTKPWTRDPTRAPTRFATPGNRSPRPPPQRPNSHRNGMTSRIAVFGWTPTPISGIPAAASGRRLRLFGSASKVLRMMLQSGVLPSAPTCDLSAATGGIIIADPERASVARLTSPSRIARLRQRRQGWKRLTDLRAAAGANSAVALKPPARRRWRARRMPPAPKKPPCRRQLSLRPQRARTSPTIGKSSLARILVGVWPRRAAHSPRRPPADQCRGALGQHIGYCRRTSKLLAGTVAQNIGRFSVPQDPRRDRRGQCPGVHT